MTNTCEVIGDDPGAIYLPDEFCGKTRQIENIFYNNPELKL